MTMKFGGMINSIKDETWESLLLTADNDFISVLVLWYSGIGIGSTYAWMLPHTIEKYLKSYLLKFNFITNPELKKFGKNGHSLDELWGKYKLVSSCTTSKPNLNQGFEDLIVDLSTITTKLRYSGYIEFSSDKLLYFFIVLSSLIRYLIIGKQKYRETLYGLEEDYFDLMNYQPMSYGYGKMIVHKMLHLTLEHGCSFTNMGSINSWDFEGLSISNTAKFEVMKNCPICEKQRNIDQLKLIKFYRDIRPTEIEKK